MLVFAREGGIVLVVRSLDLTTGTSLRPGKLTIVIGPNNGGKSQFLKDITTKISSPRAVTPSLSNSRIEALPTWHAALDKMASILKVDDQGQLVFDRLSPELTAPKQFRHSQSMVQQFMVSDSVHSHDGIQESALEIFGSFFLANLGTETRLNLVNRQTSARQDISGPGSVPAAMQTAEQGIRDWINQQVRGAFENDLIVDDSASFQIGLVLGKEEDISTHYKERRDALASLPKTEEQGDGVRAFCGVVAAAATTDRSIILIDEPEAFLHPPQALLMGKALT